MPTQWSIHLRVQGTREGDEHPAYTLHYEHGTLYVFNSWSRQHQFPILGAGNGSPTATNVVVVLVVVRFSEH